MASINYATREISCKVVFYGPGLSGKTTNLQIIHRKIPDKDKSEMVSLATETDRTLFFDFLPLDLGSIKGFSTKFQLYTVPGQVYYNATRKLVLRGVDGVVFVVDSQIDKMQENLESFANLQENLREYGHSVESIPLVLQYNKRDLPNIYPVDQLNSLFNKHNLPVCEAVAATGVGVFTTLKTIGKIVIDRFNAKYSGFQGATKRMQPGQTAQAPAAARPAAAPVPPPPASAPMPQFPPGGGPSNFPPQNPMVGPVGTPRPMAPSPGGFPPAQNPFMGGGAPLPGGNPPYMNPAQPGGGGIPGGFPGNSGFAGAPQSFPSGANPFPSQMPGPGRGPAPAFPPPGGGQPFGNMGGPRAPFPGGPATPGPGPGGNIPVAPFLDNFGSPRMQSPGGNPPPMQGLEGPGVYPNAPAPRPGAPFPGQGGAPGQPPPFPGARGPVGPPFPGADPPAYNPPPGAIKNPGAKGPFEDTSGIVSTYEDARDENLKTRKLPLPGEKKKGFFDGLFRKDNK